MTVWQAIHALILEMRGIPGESQRLRRTGCGVAVWQSRQNQTMTGSARGKSSDFATDPRVE